MFAKDKAAYNDDFEFVVFLPISSWRKMKNFGNEWEDGEPPPSRSNLICQYNQGIISIKAKHNKFEIRKNSATRH